MASQETGPTSSMEAQYPVIIPSSYTALQRPDTFTNPSYGVVTWHTLFSKPKTKSSEMSAGIAICPPGIGSLEPHRHTEAEIYFIIEGEGEITIDGACSHVSKGCAIFIPSNAEHSIINTGSEDLRWFYVFATDKFEDVIYRFTRDMQLE